MSIAAHSAARIPLCRRCDGKRVRATQISCAWTPPGKTMGEVVEQLARHALRAVPEGGQRHVVGVAGCPGGGKTTTVAAVVHAVNRLAGSGIATVLPMDGFHYYRRQLDAMPDAALAHSRRGAPFTFDAAGFVAAVGKVRDNSAAVTAPSFDHAAGDPVPDGVRVEAHHRLVFVEGNYLFLPEEPWCQLSSLFHDRWFVHTDPQTAMQRIVARHMAVWGSTLEEATSRVRSNDGPNAELVWTTRERADPQVWVPVIEDAAFASAK